MNHLGVGENGASWELQETQGIAALSKDSRAGSDEPGLGHGCLKALWKAVTMGISVPTCFGHIRCLSARQVFLSLVIFTYETHEYYQGH